MVQEDFLPEAVPATWRFSEWLFRRTCRNAGSPQISVLGEGGINERSLCATGAAVAFLIDLSRLTISSRLIIKHQAEFDYALVSAVVICAFLGATLGNRYLPKVTMTGIQTTVAIMLLVVSLGLISGLL